MNTMYTIIVVIQVLSALTIIGLVLLQHGKGADMGAAFGSGASGSLFGATGSSNFLSKSTGVAAAVFFIATLSLAYLGSNRSAVVGGGVMENLQGVPVTAPAPVGTTSPVPGAAVPAGTASAPATPATSTAPASNGTVPASAAPAAPAAAKPAPAATAPVPPAPASGAGQSSQIPK